MNHSMIQEGMPIKPITELCFLTCVELSGNNLTFDLFWRVVTLKRSMNDSLGCLREK